MEGIQFTKNGKPWQEQVQAGESVDIDISNKNENNCSGRLATVKDVSASLILTECGIYFDKKTLKALNPPSVDEVVHIIPDLSDPFVKMVKPTIPELMTEMSLVQAIEYLESFEEEW